MTQTPKDGGPAFPQNDLSNYNLGPDEIGDGMGMSLRAYAAIQLRVPDSGIDWLDDTIRQSQRDAFAGQALAELILAYTQAYGSPKAAPDKIATEAYRFADAMLAERERRR